MIKSCKATNHAQQPRSRGQGDSQKETTLENKSECKGKSVQPWQRKPGKKGLDSNSGEGKLSSTLQNVRQLSRPAKAETRVAVQLNVYYSLQLESTKLKSFESKNYRK